MPQGLGKILSPNLLRKSFWKDVNAERSGVGQPPCNAAYFDVDPPVQAELFHGVGLVRLDGLDADRQPGRDLLVAVARGNQLQDLRLPRADRR